IILDWDKYEATNSVILIDPSARQIQDYAKMHPVPFAEAVPLWEYPWFRRFMQEVVGYPGGWIMGTEYTVFELPTTGGLVRFGAPICFEDAFSEVCRGYFEAGADLLINLTNDSWSKTVSAEIQHWAAARFRSIEYRRTLVRSTNGGFSCVVGPYGELIDSLPLFEARAVRTEIPIYKDETETVYMAFGNWFALGSLLLCAVWAIILMAAPAIRAVRKRRPAS
ncbi:MAG: apolipoprotein N-acyltransferase, partial [Spirochaetaceae bacterium]|nr:apolipoprotein N-acyltransferase [Spirochaetaceae bacterium]